ncbi:MAG: signal peptide peptidase SppA [Smithellaceae bacterium]|nr:signal peptide peptidase SppA [Smithellaceae bacterium]
MKKHPIILGIVIFAAFGLVFFLSVYIITRMFHGGSVISLSDRVGVVEIEGPITDSRQTVKDIEEFVRDGSIRAIVLRIDSPGGGVAPSQEIYQAVLEAKTKKKVVASLGSIAASGGYLVAAAAEQIVANPGTITGSLSAVMYFPNVEELLKKLGVSSSVVKSGRFKDIGSPVRMMTKEEKLLLQELVDDIYDQFLEAVSSARNIPRKELLKIADGRIFTGRYAKEAGLVDSLGDLGAAVRLAAKLAEIKGEPTVVYAKKKTSSWIEALLMNFAGTREILEKAFYPKANYQYF